MKWSVKYHCKRPTPSILIILRFYTQMFGMRKPPAIDRITSTKVISHTSFLIFTMANFTNQPPIVRWSWRSHSVIADGISRAKWFPSKLIMLFIYVFITVWANWRFFMSLTDEYYTVSLLIKLSINHFRLGFWFEEIAFFLFLLTVCIFNVSSFSFFMYL
jgi:hypothetical protein